MGELCHVGARFEALDESVLTAPSVSSCIFFTILTLPSERCVGDIESVPGYVTLKKGGRAMPIGGLAISFL